MVYKLYPIQDELLANNAVDWFIAGQEPLLYAADLGATPEQVWDTLRIALQHCRDNHSRPTAGRKLSDTSNPKSLAKREQRARKKS